MDEEIIALREEVESIPAPTPNNDLDFPSRMQRDYNQVAIASQIESLVRAQEEAAPQMTADEIFSKPIWPRWDPALHQYLDKPIGYVCQSPAGNLVKLVQPYDSTIYTEPPEQLPAQWGFYWSTEPKYARPFLSLSTSPYMTGDVCMTGVGANGLIEGPLLIWRSTIDNNVWSPLDAPQYWEELGPYEQFYDKSRRARF